MICRLVVLAMFALCGVARAQAVAAVAAGGSEHFSSLVTNLGLSIDGSVGWRFRYQRLVWAAVTVAPGIRLGARVGDWIPSLAMRVGALIHGQLSQGADGGGSSHGVAVQLDPAVDWLFSQHFGMRLHFGVHIALGSGSEVWMSFGPAIMVYE